MISEGRCRVRESLLGHTSVHRDDMNVSTKQQRIAELAQRYAGEGLTTLHHHLDLEWLRVAYERVRKDGAPGVDGVTWASYGEQLEANLIDLLKRVKSGCYRAPPVRRVHIPKGDGKETRPIGIPTLEEIWESCTQLGIRWIVDADIRKYFDTIDHGKLREMLRRRVQDGVILRLLDKWLKAGVLEDGVWRRSEAGSPQGGVISPLMSVNGHQN